MTRYLVTGGCGFIGANFIRLLRAERPDAEIVNLDLLTYAGNLANLSDLADDPGYRLVKGGIADDSAVAEAFREGVDVVVNFAAESHVDRSILGPREFVTTNVLGTQVLLEQAHAAGVSCFLQVGTDEVYGSLGAEGLFTEQTNLSPRSPYSASKAGADMLVLAYHETFGLPTIVSRCCNNYGPYQFPEKVVPLFVTNLLDGRQVPRRRPLSGPAHADRQRPLRRDLHHRQPTRVDQSRPDSRNPRGRRLRQGDDRARHRPAGTRSAIRDRPEQDHQRTGLATTSPIRRRTGPDGRLVP